ncbi:MAG: hypothetical protein DRJ49_01535 [Thermoprotei archaeon]|nr:MAG: hypothetical protein DRN53_02005 [Thermoprotei archaeon]RLE89928.1 MAG: hypothetical protein DRJ49_01535 [Thermoprotei archaeon]
MKIVSRLTALLLILLDLLPLYRLVFKRRLILKVPSRVFKPIGTVTTSALVRYLLRKIQGGDGRIVDVGCGSGVVGLLLAKETKNYIIMTDIDPVAVRTTWANALMNHVDSNTDVILTNLLAPFRERSIDIIVSNPPLLPINISTIYHIPIAAGSSCSLLFLLISHASIVCSKNGRVVLTLSTISDFKRILKYAETIGFDVKVVDSARGLFDRILIVELIKL